MSARTVGYMRISTPSQSFALQRDAMKREGINETVEEIATDNDGGVLHQLDAVCASLGEGDTLTVWRIDRLGRERGPLIARIDGLSKRGVRILSITEGIDTSKSVGELLAGYQALQSHHERAVLKQRTRAGMEAARKAGKHIGRRYALSRVQRAEVLRLVLEEGRTGGEVARLFDVSPSTISRLLKRERESES